MNSYQSYNENELFRLIATGEEAAFREIFNRFTPRLYPFVFDIVKTEAIAREIVQEVFLRLWIKREGLAEIEKPASWLYRVASNISLTHFRRRQLEQKITAAIQKNSPAEKEEDHLSVKELQGMIHSAAHQLPSLRRKIFTMSREWGLSRKEIAAQLGISENTVRNQLVIALKHIQDYIEKSSGIYIPAFFLLQALLHN